MKQTEYKTAQTNVVSSNRLYTRIRLILGCLLSSAVVFSMLNNSAQAVKSPLAEKVLTGLWDTGYLMQMVKIVEFLFAACLVTNRYVKLGSLLYVPIIINIILFDLFADNLRGLLTAIPLLLLLVTIMWINFQAYRPVLSKK